MRSLRSRGERPRWRIRAFWAAFALIGGGMVSAGAGEGYGLLKGHGGPVKGVAISEDGQRVLTASFDYSVGLWDASGTRLRWLDGHEAAANAVAFLPGERALSVGDDFDMILWNLASGEPIRRFEGHEGKIISVAVSPDARLAATAGWDGVVGLWPLEGMGAPRFLEGHDSSVNDVAFSADGTMLFTAGYDGTIRRWSVSRGEEEAVLVRHGFGVNNLVVNEAAGWLAYGAVDGTVRAIELATGESVADVSADRRPILALETDRSGRLLAAGDGQGYIMVVDTTDWNVVRDFRAALDGPIWALDWEPSGRRILAGSITDEAAFWPIDTNGDALFASGPRDFHTPPSEMTNGERQFVRKCSICHTLTPESGRKAGPTLHALFGRPAGAIGDYSYSDALAESDIVWSEETVGRLFEEGPDVFTPGSKMPTQRIVRAEDRHDLIEYLKDNSGPEWAARRGAKTP